MARSYLYKRKLSISENCVFCHERDTVEHAIFHCRRFGWKRRRLEVALGGPLEVESCVEAMCGSEDVWKAVTGYVKFVLKLREEEARKRE